MKALRDRWSSRGCNPLLSLNLSENGAARFARWRFHSLHDIRSVKTPSSKPGRAASASFPHGDGRAATRSRHAGKPELTERISWSESIRACLHGGSSSALGTRPDAIAQGLQRAPVARRLRTSRRFVAFDRQQSEVIEKGYAAGLRELAARTASGHDEHRAFWLDNASERLERLTAEDTSAESSVDARATDAC
ncbi:MAG: hypothetical protein ACT4O5_10850 [Gammaproteobacteria bacterium]